MDKTIIYAIVVGIFLLVAFINELAALREKSSSEYRRLPKMVLIFANILLFGMLSLTLMYNFNAPSSVNQPSLNDIGSPMATSIPTQTPMPSPSAAPLPENPEDIDVPLAGEQEPGNLLDSERVRWEIAILVDILLAFANACLSLYIHSHPANHSTAESNPAGKTDDAETSENAHKKRGRPTKMIYLVILLWVLMLAVMVFVIYSGIRSGWPTNHTTDKTLTPDTSEETIVTPTVGEIKIYYSGKEKTDFTMHSGEEPILVTAVGYPQELFEDVQFDWSCNDVSCMKISVSEDTRSCTCEIVSPRSEPVELVAAANGAKRTIYVYLRD